MRFLLLPDLAPLSGLLRYVEPEHSFNFDAGSPADLQRRTGRAGVTSMSIGTLQLEVGIESGLVLFAWGLHPSISWNRESIGRPHTVPGGLRVESELPLQRGVSLALAPVGAWVTSFDEASGWVRISQDPNHASAVEVAVATGVALGVTDGRLDAVWLEPIFE